MKLSKELNCLIVGLAFFSSLSMHIEQALAFDRGSKNLSNFTSPQIAQSPTAINHFNTLAEADRLFLTGQMEEAENLYRQVKPAFSSTLPPREEPIYETDVNQLSGALKVYWRNAIDGIERDLNSQIFVSLRALTEEYPQFIAGHLTLAEACKEKPEDCESSAKENQPINAIQILERATTLYPDQPDLIRGKISALAEAESYLEASIIARQFSIIDNDQSFSELADEYFGKYNNRLQRNLIGLGIFSTLGSIGTALHTGDWSYSASGVQTILLLSQGEAKFGQDASRFLVNSYRQQDKIVDNPEVINYLEDIAGRLTPSFGRDFEYEIYLVQDDSLNAFALPGGKIFVNTGAIQGANSEAELAGLLAHEFSHSVLSHGYQNFFRSSLFSNIQANLAQEIPLSSFVSAVVQGQFSQEQERQSDILATRVIANAGYAADGVRNLIAKFEQSETNPLEDWASTHPTTTERVRYLESFIQSNGYNRYALEGVERHAEIQRMLGN